MKILHRAEIRLREFRWHLRHERWYVPWRLVMWLGDRNIWCWSDLVTWRVCKSEWPTRNTGCVKPLPDGRLTCYCGFWDHLPQPTTLTASAQGERAHG